MRRFLQSLLIAAIFTAIAYHRLSPAFEPGQSIAIPDDGTGTIGIMYDMNDQVHRNGITSAFSATYRSDTLGGGLNIYGIPSSFLQRLTYWGVGSFTASADNIYDWMAGLAIVLGGVAGFYLGRAAGLGRIMSFLLALALYMLPNLNAKIGAHLFLGFSVGPILLCATALSYARRPEWSNLLGLLLAVWLNFLISEYYGYFGLFVAVTIATSSILYGKDLWRFRFVRIVVHGGMGALLLSAMMAITFPDIIGAKLRALGGKVEPMLANFSREDYEFILHAIYRPWTLFQPSIPLLRRILVSPSTLDYGSEYLYRFGLIIPLSVVLGLIWQSVVAFRKNKVTPEFHLLLAIILGAAIAICAALVPKIPFSLVPFTQKFAPMFRVSVRSVFYAQILLTLGFAVTINALIANFRTLTRFKPWPLQALIAPVVLILFFLGLSDIDPAFLRAAIAPFPVSKMQQFPVAEQLKDLGDGYLLELPFNTPGGLGGAEDDYPYYAARVIHGKPIINGGLPFTGELGNVLVRMAMVGRFNRAEPRFVDVVRQLGIRYVSITRSPKVDELEAFARLDGLKLVIDSPEQKVFEVERREEFSVAKLRQWVWAEPMLIKVASLASQVDPLVMVSSPESPAIQLRQVEVKIAPAFIIFGPYLPLEAGTYRVTFSLDFKGSLAEAAAVAADVDVLSSEEGGVQLQSISSGELRDNHHFRVDLPFTFQRPGTVQVRVLAKSGGVYTVGDMQFSRMAPAHGPYLAQKN